MYKQEKLMKELCITYHLILQKFVDKLKQKLLAFNLYDESLHIVYIQIITFNNLE